MARERQEKGKRDSKWQVEEKDSKKEVVKTSFSVGVSRLELPTTRPPDAYANQLRHTPNTLALCGKKRVQRYYNMMINPNF